VSCAITVVVAHGTDVPAQAVKNKYSTLKRDFSAIRLAESATGNATSVAYPAYWDAAVSAFGDKAGLGHTDYAFGAAVFDEDHESDIGSAQDDGSSLTSKRQAAVDAEMARQRAKRPKKMDIGQSLVALGESLAQGMKGLHQPITNQAQDRENAKLLDAIEKLHTAVEQSSAVQAEILNFLRQK
jgi:hypothetical protein